MQKLIIANWKSNKSPAQAGAWAQEVAALGGQEISTGVTPIVALAFTLLPAVSESLQKIGWSLATQDLSPFAAGSYTGAVSAINLQGLNVRYAILGHSERRRYFQETSAMVAQKVDQALQAGLTPVVCVDEKTVAEQARVLGADVTGQCIVAYEPSESIGTGNNAPVGKVKEFREEVMRLFGAVPFIYGGSVNESNAAEYLLVADGVLVGEASLDAKQFIALLHSARGNSQAAV